MPAKRRKRSPAPNKGLLPGESLQRYLVPIGNPQSALWAWVGTEVSQATDITPEHCQMAYGLSARNANPFCKNKYVAPQAQIEETHSTTGKEIEPREDDIIVVSEDEEVTCTKKSCKDNPNCLNYLGQDMWEDEENAMKEFLNMTTEDFNPITDKRESDLPVGLRNLGATCYANASLQVWFRILAFRKCVYQCQPRMETAAVAKDSPLFQLQATFAGLQESSRKVFNPTSLVESLQLRASEQQDAQEFSKLFMSLLDSEFKKQSVPELRSLVSDQFQGTQLYGTVCDSCGYRSERTTDFLEIEIRFERNSQLEDCVRAMLQEEKLTGDNQYRCPQCNDLRDATRYTQLTQLPPILHFSLLRFVYDFSTMERKKSKYTISFPTTLDMNKFLVHDTKGSNQEQENNVYELAGILLHKGASAYHGHYEAQVYDTEKRSWFQFNDEVVTKIKTLGDKKSAKEVSNVENNANPPSDNSQSKRPIKKKRRIVTDDEESSAQDQASKTITSKDAYMLIYVRRSIQRNKKIQIPIPSSQALEFVHTQNREHEEECKLFIEKEKSTKESFASIRQQVVKIYRTWNARSIDDDCVIVNQPWLQNWLARDCMHLAKPTLPVTEPKTSNDSAETTNESLPVKPDDGIRCEHHKLDPMRAKKMKRIRRDAYQKMIELTGCNNEPLPSAEDVCKDCVLREFQGRLYNIEHPKLVKEFDEISEIKDDALGYWISKKWLKDWRLSKPKMHRASVDDPAPDSLGYREHVLCEHGALASNSLNRRIISEQAVHLLQGLFPSWEPLRNDAEPCTICEALVQISKEDKRESRRRAEEEKVLLRLMYDEVPFTEQDHTFAIIPAEFFNCWQSWLTSPAGHIRPDRLDTSSFLCEHALLIFDPNCPSDMEMTATVIRQADWDVLEALYDAGPRIGLRKATRNGGDNKVYESDILVCESCSLKRKTEWVTTDITVQLLRGQQMEASTNRQPITTYSNKNGTRQSKRLRQSREGEKRRFSVTKKTTIKDIRIKIQEAYKIPTICQRLFFRGQEVQDSEATLEDLQIYANEVLELREENEVHGSDSDLEGHPVKKQRRETERGFGGTVLAGVAGEQESSQCRNSSPNSQEGTMPTDKFCTACTLLNVYDAVACQVCDTLFV